MPRRRSWPSKKGNARFLRIASFIAAGILTACFPSDGDFPGGVRQGTSGIEAMFAYANCESIDLVKAELVRINRPEDNTDDEVLWTIERIESQAPSPKFLTVGSTPAGYEATGASPREVAEIPDDLHLAIDFAWTLNGGTVEFGTDFRKSELQDTALLRYGTYHEPSELQGRYRCPT